MKIREEAGFDSHYEVVRDFSISTSQDRSVSSFILLTTHGIFTPILTLNKDHQ